MRRLLAASVAAPALILAAPAWAQPYPETYAPESYPPGSYDQGYDQGYDPGAAGAYDDAPAEPDYSQADPGQDDRYAMDPDDDYDASGDDGYPADPGGTGDEGAPQYPPYESVPPSAQDYPSKRPAYPSRGYSYRSPQAMTPPMEPQYAGGVPSDLLQREDRLEQRIRSGGDRGLVPPFHVDNLMVQLDSIRAQQEELAARDGGLNHTTRTFIESRLARLERNVTW